MNTSSEPLDDCSPLLTYLRLMVFAVPALVFGFFTSSFVLPKVEQMWRSVGGFGGEVRWPLDTARFLLHNGHYGILAAAVLLVLTFRAPRLARYRQLTVGAVVFATNSAVLFALTALCLAAILAAPYFAR